MLRSGEGWPKACGVPCSIKFSLNHFLWTLYVNTGFLRCVPSGYCDEHAGIKIYCTVLLKNWTVWFKSYLILKMSGIDGSFILYNNLLYWCTNVENLKHFMKIQVTISRTTEAILGLFVLIWMHLSCWIQIWWWKFEIFEKVRKFWSVICTLQSVANFATCCLQPLGNNYCLTIVILTDLKWWNKTQPVYTPIAFDERVFFWLQRAWSLPCACVLACSIVCMCDCIMVICNASLRANNATYAHAQGSDRTRWSQNITLSSKAIKL